MVLIPDKRTIVESMNESFNSRRNYHFIKTKLGSEKKIFLFLLSIARKRNIRKTKENAILLSSMRDAMYRSNSSETELLYTATGGGVENMDKNQWQRPNHDHQSFSVIL